MKKITIILILIFISSCSTHRNAGLPKTTVKQFDKELLSRFHLFCEGHVTGAPSHGKVGAHILWKAYYSEQNPDTLVSRFNKYLRKEANKEESCAAWRYLQNKPLEIIEVCNKNKPRPWTRCDHKLPNNAKSIIMRSTMIK